MTGYPFSPPGVRVDGREGRRVAPRRWRRGAILADRRAGRRAVAAVPDGPAMHRAGGPFEGRPVGETELGAGLAAMARALALASGPSRRLCPPD
jgi:hypothetical protein